MAKKKKKATKKEAAAPATGLALTAAAPAPAPAIAAPLVFQPAMAAAADEARKPWLSKTVWVAAITALAPLYPPIGAIVAANPETVAAVVGAVFAGLRMLSSGKVGLK
jgi:hypothetical protein